MGPEVVKREWREDRQTVRRSRIATSCRHSRCVIELSRCVAFIIKRWPRLLMLWDNRIIKKYNNTDNASFCWCEPSNTAKAWLKQPVFLTPPGDSESRPRTTVRRSNYAHVSGLPFSPPNFMPQTAFVVLSRLPLLHWNVPIIRNLFSRTRVQIIQNACGVFWSLQYVRVNENIQGIKANWQVIMDWNFTLMKDIFLCSLGASHRWLISFFSY